MVINRPDGRIYPKVTLCHGVTNTEFQDHKRYNNKMEKELLTHDKYRPSYKSKSTVIMNQWHKKVETGQITKNLSDMGDL